MDILEDDLDFIDIENVKESPMPAQEEPCKGLHFRGHRSIFYDSKKHKIERRENITLLKRISCKGCAKCEWLYELYKESVEMDSLAFPTEIEDGAIYGIVIHTSTNWETGYEDIDYIEIIKE
jgi:hypothetical protein